MAKEKLPMRKTRDILRYHLEGGISPTQTARALHVSRGAVLRCIQRFHQSGLAYPLPGDLSDDALEKRLYPSFSIPEKPLGESVSKAIDWEAMRRELSRKGVTLRLLWEEYRNEHPAGDGYSWFCEQYGRHVKNLDVCFHHAYIGGETSFVDYSGTSIDIVDRETGEVKKTQLFVWTWGASNYTYLEFTQSQKIPDFLGSHQRGLAYFGCAPKRVVPDNLKSAVVTACRYEPQLNYNYERLAEHYGFCVLPARSGHPRDKAKVEGHVLIVQRQVVARLRDRLFFSLHELNEAASALLETLNTKVMKGLGQSRRELFLATDKPSALPLPDTHYGTALWKHPVRLGIDYHFEAEGNFYSTPYTLRGNLLAVKIGEGLVEAFYNGNRVASHARLFGRGKYSTDPAHMPESHRQYKEWNSERVVNWAEKIGAKTAAFARALLSNKTHPQQAYRSILGVIRLEKTHGKERLEKACERAHQYRQMSYKAVLRILQMNLDKKPHAGAVRKESLPLHENIRGEGYYQHQKQGDGNDSIGDACKTTGDETLPLGGESWAAVGEAGGKGA
jgi:transposase